MTNTVTTLNGMFMETYANKVENLVPEATKVANDAGFCSREQMPGNSYHQPVRLTRAHGWTMNGTTGGAYTLNNAEAPISQDATVQGSSFTMQEEIGYDEAARLMKGKGEARKRAFVEGSSYLVESLLETAAFIRETQLLYGQTAIGIIDGDPGTGPGNRAITFTTGTWIPALWSGMENAFIDVYDTTEATQRNNSGTAMQVVSVDVANRQVTISGDEGDLDDIATTDVVYLRGTKTNGMLGLRSIVSNTGTMFGIAGATYSLWTGNTKAITGSLVFAKVMQALTLAANRGLTQGVTMYVSPNTWTDLNNDIAALRQFGESKGGSVVQGNEDISYYTHTGKATIKPHIFMKPSEAIWVPTGKCKRIGASDISFTVPGAPNDNFFENISGKAGYSLRCYWNQAIFLPCPNQGGVITGIVNSDAA